MKYLYISIVGYEFGVRCPKKRGVQNKQIFKLYKTVGNKTGRFLCIMNMFIVYIITRFNARIILSVMSTLLTIYTILAIKPVLAIRREHKI